MGRHSLPRTVLLSSFPSPPRLGHAQVEFPDGRRTLCLIPAKFHKKLWIKNGNFLVVEAAEGVDAAVTGQIVQVLYAEHVKQLQRMPGVWCAPDAAWGWARLLR